MKTKYIKVSVSERLPKEETWVYFNSKTKPNLFLEYYVENKKEMILNLTEYWLEEVPDHEEEMKNILLQIIGCHTIGDKIPDWLNDKAEELLTKLKQQS